jgi:hypothetical protein
MYAGAVLKSMLGHVTTGVIPRELMTTNRVMERWAVANGSGLPTEQWDDNPRRSRVPPLDDDTALVVDAIVQHSPPKTRRLVVGWYMRPVPTRELARELSMSPRSLEKGLHVSLNYLQYKFEGSNHLTLLKLLRVRV